MNVYHIQPMNYIHFFYFLLLIIFIYSTVSVYHICYKIYQYEHHLLDQTDYIPKSISWISYEKLSVLNGWLRNINRYFIIGKINDHTINVINPKKGLNQLQILLKQYASMSKKELEQYKKQNINTQYFDIKINKYTFIIIIFNKITITITKHRNALFNNVIKNKYNIKLEFNYLDKQQDIAFIQSLINNILKSKYYRTVILDEFILLKT
jgi:hypothetical protein